MEITDVRVYIVNEGNLKAYASVTISDCFIIKDLKVILGHGGLFIAMPNKKRKDGRFHDIAHPINKEGRHILEQAIFEAYEAQQEYFKRDSGSSARSA